MIQVRVVSLTEHRAGDSPVAVFVFEEAGLAGAASLPPAVRKALWSKGQSEFFKGKASEIAAFAAADGAKERRFVLVGLGKRKEFNAEVLRKAAGALSRFARKRFKTIDVFPAGDAQALAEGILLGAYRFEEYRKPEDDAVFAEARIVSELAGSRAKLGAAVAKAALYAEAVCFTRDLVNRGPSDKTPESLAKLAHSLVDGDVTVEVVDRKDAEKLGMGSYLSVARGSTAPPAFVHLAYKPKGARKKVGLVGKGITFDSGGLSLKPPQSMEEMKMDMAGAASVLAVFKVLPRLKAKAEVHGFCAFTYNMPGPDATKPGDVVKAMNGKTIEVLNTDAEGRLVLADALVYAARQGLDAVFDYATLTGAALVALGSGVTAAMTNDRRLLSRFKAAADRAGEKVWELPLVKEYEERLKSNVADLRNISKVRAEAGTIIGGLFLKEFVEGKPWVHFDIAGPAWAEGEDSYVSQGGTGALVRSTLEYLAAL